MKIGWNFPACAYPNHMRRLNLFMAAILVSMVVSQPVFASAWHLGIGVGGNRTSVLGNATTPVPRTINFESYNLSAAASLAFFQDSLFGLHLVGDLLNLNAVSGSDRASGQIVSASALASVNFDVVKTRGSVGVGVTYGRTFNKSSSLGNLTLADSMPGVVAQIKEMWKAGQSHYFFAAARAYLWPDAWAGPGTASLASVNVIVGLDI